MGQASSLDWRPPFLGNQELIARDSIQLRPGGSQRACRAIATEGWHNNHHADPSSATNQRRWWEIDLTYLFLSGLALVGLAWDVQLPKRCHDSKLKA